MKDIVVLVDSNYLSDLEEILLVKPYLNLYSSFKLTDKHNPKVIHNLKFFIEELKKLEIKAIKFKNDFIYLMSVDDVYKYNYGYYIKNLTI